jgi:hypothetical protein
MTSAGLLRAAGLAGLVGGILIAIVNPVAALSGVYAAASSRVAPVLFALSVLIGIALVLLGLVGVYVSQAEATGTLGLLGFLLSFLGMIMIAGLYWARAFVVPPLQPAPAGLLLTISVAALGWLIFGIATLKGRIYPRPASLVLMIGAVLSAIPGPATEVVLVLAIAWLGYYLFSGRRVAAAQAPPRVS